MLEPWLDLVDTVVDNVTFGEALAVVNNADMVRPLVFVRGCLLPQPMSS